MPYGMSINTLRWHTRQFTTQHQKTTLSSPSKTFGRTLLDHPSYFSISFFTFQHHTSVTHKKAWCTRSSKDLFL
ncbi:hypothetical protein HanIR_Chr10g0465991 [Helianthus annuus]|nr:hypothetical protein HanIR_Chr10g0465991 [Helianthus annuus]